MVHLSNLRRRLYLTYRYRGPGTLVYRAVTFPLRYTPLRPYLRLEPTVRTDPSVALRWYRKHGRPVTVVIPSYRDAEHVARLVRSIRRTTRTWHGLLGPRYPVRIVVADDASGPEHIAALRRIRRVEVIEGGQNVGFSGNVNRGLARSVASEDVVVLNSDMVARRAWLACLQHAAHREADVGIVGAKLLYPDNVIQFGGTIRNATAPEWFDHRYRGKPAGFGPANIRGPALAVTGACMYLKRSMLDSVGGFDEEYPMAYEDVDLCLRAWQAGYRVIYCPEAELEHLESITRGSHVGDRERRSQQVFWGRWSDFFDARPVRESGGALRIVYVTQDTGVGGGHRVVFEHLNHLARRGHNVELWSLSGPPDWFELHVPVRAFRGYRELIEALWTVDALKVATWWETADAVWEASIVHGIPVYLVQDIETSYYRDSDAARHRVLASYRPEFRYLTTSSWNLDQLAELGFEATVVAPGIDLGTFRPLPDVQRRTDMILALGRSNPLKNLPLTLEAWRSLPDPRPELCLFGIEPELATGLPGVSYVESPSDTEVSRLLNQATAFIQTSDHEGFCLPVLEAMATGCPVICTDAHGNRDFCRDGQNCLMPASHPRELGSALLSVLGDPALRERLGGAGIQTAGSYAWDHAIDTLERFFASISAPRRIVHSTDAVPNLRRAPAG